MESQITVVHYFIIMIEQICNLWGEKKWADLKLLYPIRHRPPLNGFIETWNAVSLPVWQICVQWTSQRPFWKSVGPRHAENAYRTASASHRWENRLEDVLNHRANLEIEVVQTYRDYFEKPFSKRSHNLLHTNRALWKCPLSPRVREVR